MAALHLDIATSPYQCDTKTGIRVHIQCIASEGLSNKIFAYLRNVTGDHFNHVCSTVDMMECPEDTPSAGYWPKWFRKDYIDLIVHHVDTAYDFIENVKKDVEALYANMQRHNSLITEPGFTVGNPEDLPVVSE